MNCKAQLNELDMDIMDDMDEKSSIFFLKKKEFSKLKLDISLVTACSISYCFNCYLYGLLLHIIKSEYQI